MQTHPANTPHPCHIATSLTRKANLARWRMTLLVLGVFVLALMGAAWDAGAQPTLTGPDDARLLRAATIESMQDWPEPEEDALVETLGFHEPGDGGAALYRVQQPTGDLEPNGADVIALEDGLAAVLLERNAVNYRIFGAVGDGENDDGAQIKLAHEYAREHGVPVVNLSGEFWIKETNDIPIRTNVSWGNTIFHIDERYNDRRTPRFVVLNDEPSETIELDDELKEALLEQIRPGTQIISELAPWSNHMIIVQDTGDRIGIRAGYDNHRGWAREDFFYVEEEGRIIGDISWAFDDFTSVTAIPCNDSYLTIEGGGFRMSGHTPDTGSTGYHRNGFSIQRSRTIIRDQWMGLQEGRRDESLAARGGFYTLSRVYDVTLENIRLIPWEKSRRDPDEVVPHGTYGIGGSRMLNCTFRNLTADAGPVSWGVFGTNLTKNLRIEDSHLNRVDVHFHCHNLYIKDSTIGLKGITVTGAGDLFLDNTIRHGNNFVSFRRDYGSKWDGRIRLRGCTLKPSSNATISVLNYRMADFDYQYPIGFGRDIAIEDLVIDYGAAPGNQSPAWLMGIPSFSGSGDAGRLFFPTQVRFKNIRVQGREQGVRLMNIPNPHDYDLGRPGGYDGDRLTPNATINVENVQLEQLTPEGPGDTGNTHLRIGGGEAREYADERALYPRIRFADCDGVSLYLGNVKASAHFERSSLNTVSVPGLEGELTFSACTFQPHLQDAGDGNLYTIDSTLGTRFTNCTVHAPIINGEPRPELVDRMGFLEINGPVRHYHINTGLSNHVLDYLREEDIELDPSFIDRLRLSHALEQ